MSTAEPAKRLKYSYISIEGVIGVGKTSLCRLLASAFDARTVLEKVEENPFLPAFYRDRTANAFQTQIWFLLSRYRQLTQEAMQQDLFHDVTVADYMFAKDRIFAGINLDDQELALYNNIAAILEARIARPELVIYLQASTERILQRVEKRGRDYEFGMDKAYLAAINRAYDHFFFHHTESPVLVIDTNDIDFVENACDLQEITEQIVQAGPGLNFYRPLGARERARLGGAAGKNR